MWYMAQNWCSIFNVSVHRYALSFAGDILLVSVECALSWISMMLPNGLTIWIFKICFLLCKTKEPLSYCWYYYVEWGNCPVLETSKFEFQIAMLSKASHRIIAWLKSTILMTPIITSTVIANCIIFCYIVCIRTRRTLIQCLLLTFMLICLSALFRICIFCCCYWLFKKIIIKPAWIWHATVWRWFNTCYVRAILAAIIFISLLC